MAVDPSSTHNRRRLLYFVLILKLSTSCGFTAIRFHPQRIVRVPCGYKHNLSIAPSLTAINQGRSHFLQVKSQQSKLMLSKQEIKIGEPNQERRVPGVSDISPVRKMQNIYTNLRTISELLHANNGQYQNLLPNVVRKTIPPLSVSSHKGSSGRIAVLGGSEKYTGAPYYAAMSALRTGADLATIYCAQEASTAIKTYSPELMVDPVYEACKMQQSNLDASQRQTLVQDMVEKVLGTLDRMHALVIGPGLGRDPLVMDATAEIIKNAIGKGMSMVLDADALYLLSLQQYSWLIEEIRRNAAATAAVIVLTPNVVEYKRLVNGIANGSESDFINSLPGVVVVQKGHYDVIRRFPITDVNTVGITSESKEGNNPIAATVAEMVCEEQGGLKRSGGIGDILAGSMGTFLAWNKILLDAKERVGVKMDSGNNNNSEVDDDDKVLSCWMACSLTKRATLRAFQKRKRSMTAPDILDEVGEAFDEVEALVDENSASSPF